MVMEKQAGQFIGDNADDVSGGGGGRGGKDNELGDVGKTILGNILSGKFKRKVVPWCRNSESFDTHTPPDAAASGGASKPATLDSVACKLIKPVGSLFPSDKAGALDFNAERDRCLKEHRLFEDPEFPACNESLFFKKRPSIPIEWKRPGEIVKAPQFINMSHQSRFDVDQGELGDCWLLAAVADLTLHDELFYRVVPPDQSFTENYAGIFHFQFWRYGQWVDVVVDDRLPTSGGKLVYMNSRENNEFWSALLEKSYAKLYGSYEALKGGYSSEALEDMTGGLTEFYNLQKSPKNLKEMLLGFEMGSLFGCSIKGVGETSSGLIKSHAYSITGICVVKDPTDTKKDNLLLRLRNPWGDKHEWNGAWSDQSPEWKSISQQDKDKLGLKIEHDGEFWISLDDFKSNFTDMSICHLDAEVMDEIAEMTGIRKVHQTWSSITHHGEWIKNQTAGGCHEHKDTFQYNPQYLIHLSDLDPKDDDHLCTVIVALMQKYRRELKHAGIEKVSIGFRIYDADGTSGRLDENFFSSHKPCAQTASFTHMREVTLRFRVPPGDYVIIPSTFEPNIEAQFMLRIFANSGMKSQKL